jgi:hypothetical protein
MEKDDLLFATRIKHELDYLEKIGAKLTAKPGEDKYAFLLQEIVEVSDGSGIELVIM